MYVLVLFSMSVEGDGAIKHGVREEAEGREEKQCCRVMETFPKLERFRKKIEEGDRDYGSCGKPEDEMELVPEPEGERAAKERGVVFGRRAVLTPEVVAKARRMLQEDPEVNGSVRKAAKKLGLSKNSLYRAGLVRHGAVSLP